MAKKNYNELYKSSIPAEEAAPAEEPVVEAAPAEEEEVKEETTEKKTKKAKMPFMGIVTGGLNLNVRKTPAGEIIATVADGAQVRVLEDVNDDWYKIESPAGFVMKKFIKKA